ncbi:MAG: tRNA-dihydrouridine synthase, partial [Alphaproteobacteria bacterium]|nr:tRNA-dihydrouridine synthase [Alphaproteobacteria bacterium]
MMGATHYWGRRFLRLFNQRVKIYGEMVPARALLFMQNEQKKKMHLRTDAIDQGGATASILPMAGAGTYGAAVLKAGVPTDEVPATERAMGNDGHVHRPFCGAPFQLGASEVEEALRAAEMVVAAGFGEINLNCGCPSKSVAAGDFGAVLMKNPAQVAAMARALTQHFPDTHFSIKCRIGVDDQSDDDFLNNFVATIIDRAPAITTFHIHARKALLKGLNPRQNRHLPPLDYGRVYRLKEQFPQLEVVINGGIMSLAEIGQQLTRCDGVMLGRAPIADPFLLARLESFPAMAGTNEAGTTAMAQTGALLTSDRAGMGLTGGMTTVPQSWRDVILTDFLAEFDDGDAPASCMLPFLIGLIRDEPGARARRGRLQAMVSGPAGRRKKPSLAVAFAAIA